MYHKTLVESGVTGFPKSQLWQEYSPPTGIPIQLITSIFRYALEAIDFVPHIFELIDFGSSEPLGQVLHCAKDFDFTTHLLTSYADTLTR